MADPGNGRGRGRGQALLQFLKAQMQAESDSSSQESTPQPTPAPSVVPSTLSSTSSMGGRGRMAALLLSKVQKPGGPVFSPAADTSPSPSTVARGKGRGLKLFENLKAETQAAQLASTDTASEVESLTQKMAESTVSTVQTDTTGKSKYYREVKETPPVVKMGESGVPCNVTANFIYLNFEENNVFEYEVKFEPATDVKFLRFKLLNEHRHLFKEKTFDGTTLFVPHKLPDDALRLVSTNPYDESKFTLTLIFRRTRRLSEMIQIYNVLFKHIMRDLELVRFGRQHFNERSAVQIPQHKLEVWPGYVTAVDEYEGGLMLTLDSTHRVLRTESVLSLIKQTIQTEGANWKNALSDLLVGSSVMTTYNKKIFRVDSIDDTMNPRSTFEKNEKGETVKISYMDYYKKSYGIDIMDAEQPMLISRQNKKMPGSEQKIDFMLCLVPELCQLTGLSDAQRANFRLMKDVATYTRITPNQRHAAFKKFIRSVLENETARSRLAGWGLSIAPETVALTARTLQPEAITFGNNVKVPGKPNADWNGDVCRNAVMQAVDLHRWVVLYTDRDKNVTNDFVETMIRCSKPMGIQVSKPDLIRLPNDRVDTYVQTLRKCITSQLQLVVAISPTMRDDRYSAIKRICCAEQPIPSQVINARTISNSQKIRSITQKILLQINCKLGGTLWNIAIPFRATMIVGIDSYHEATRKKKSVFAFVASYNQSMTSWYSKAVFQEKGQEVGDSCKMCVVDALAHYLRVNGRLPDRIIIYRDGVGDGQLNTVRRYEIPQMQLSIRESGVVHADYNPTLCYVVVQKRINTRIFLRQGGELANPNPGTVLDHTVTRRDWYDFLIVSQKVTQGTVTPTHYVVVHDDTGMTPDQCQRMTYKMCHLYYNWPGTVRVPAPCQYAHKLAYLVGQNMHTEPARELEDKLFFL